MDEHITGMQLGKYRVVRPLGKGGSGDVYLLEDLILKKHFALKIGERKTVLDEVERMKFITDRRFPYLVDVIEIERKDIDSLSGEDPDGSKNKTTESLLGIIMEYIEGPTLEEYIRMHAPLSEQETLMLMKQLADILGYLHSLRPALIYRDLKPANLILQSDGRLRALDFGASLQGFGRLQSVYSYGTYGYCAPEQRAGKSITPACDIYACGVVMYYMLTGINPAKPPYGISPVTEISLTVSPALEKVIDTCCREDPAERYADGSILLARLNAISTKKEEFRDRALLIAYYIVLFAAAAYTGWGIYKMYAGTGDGAVRFVGMLALCLAAYFMRKIILEKHVRRHFIKKREWNLLYTEKRTIGLWLLVMVIFLASGCVKTEKPSRLPVFVSDVLGRNILVRDGTEYDTKGDINFCLPTEDGAYYEVYFYKLNQHHLIEQEQVFLIR